MREQGGEPWPPGCPVTKTAGSLDGPESLASREAEPRQHGRGGNPLPRGKEARTEVWREGQTRHQAEIRAEGGPRRKGPRPRDLAGEVFPGPRQHSLPSEKARETKEGDRRKAERWNREAAREVRTGAGVSVPSLQTSQPRAWRTRKPRGHGESGVTVTGGGEAAGATRLPESGPHNQLLRPKTGSDMGTDAGPGLDLRYRKQKHGSLVCLSSRNTIPRHQIQNFIP